MTANTDRAAARAELLAAAYAAYYKADDDADNDRLADALDAVLADTDTLAAATGLERPETTLREWADKWAAQYPEHTFPKPDLTEAQALLSAGGITLDTIGAHLMRHVCRVMRDDADRLARESRPATDKQGTCGVCGQTVDLDPNTGWVLLDDHAIDGGFCRGGSTDPVSRATTEGDTDDH